MPIRYLILVSTFLILLTFRGWGAARDAPFLWYWQHSYLSSDEALQSAERQIDRVKTAGYTGVVFWDSGFSFLSDPFWPPQNVSRLKSALQYAANKNLQVMVPVAPFGFSNDALQQNPNWAESQRVIGSHFRVDAARRKLTFIDSFPGLQNPGFEEGEKAWFDLHDRGAAIDTDHSHSGRASGSIRYATGNARFRQLVKLLPWRQYHIRLFVKTQAFRGLSQVEILDATGLARFHPTFALLNATFKADDTSSWKSLDYTFNSRDATSAYLYLGVWGGSVGTIWFDDVQLEETALIYVTRRVGTPVKMYDPKQPKRVFQEGVDYNPIADARMTSTRTPFTDNYHEPSPVTLPATTHLKPGETVALDSYSVFPIPGLNDVGMCLTAAGVLDWQRRNADAIKSILPDGAGLLMQYDEMRQMNSCGSCRAKQMSAGQLLAWSVKNSFGLYRSMLPNAPVYAWNDMFDPYQNAVNHYYNVEGDLAGSWKGVPASVTIMNWNLGHLKKSLEWFSGESFRQPVAHKQMIAGYYDSGDGAAAARKELQEAEGIPGVEGLMYTTWRDDYSQLEPFAESARANWRTYTASLSRQGVNNFLPSALIIAGAAILVSAMAWKRRSKQ